MTRHLHFFLFLYLVAMAATCLYFSLDWLVTHDSTINYYMAQQFVNGAVPYRDIFDVNMPLTHAIYTGHMALFGASDFAFRMLDLFWLGLILLTMYVLLKGRCRWQIIGIVLAMMSLVHFSQNSDSMNQRDFMTVPFLLFACHCFLRFLRGGTLPALACAGILVGLASLIKPPAAVIGVLFLFLLWRERKFRFLPLAFLAAGFGITLAGAVSILVWIGAWPSFYEMVTQFLPEVYLQRRIYYHFPGVVVLVIAASSLSIYGLAREIIHTGKKYDAAHLLITGGIVVGCVHVILQHEYYIHHLYPLYAFLLLRLGEWLNAQYEKPDHFTLTLQWCVLAFLCIGAFYTPYDLSHMLKTEKASLTRNALIENDMERAIGSLAPRRPAGRELKVHVFDFVAGGNRAALSHGWKPQSRHILPFPLYLGTGSPLLKKMHDEALDDMKNNAPHIIFISAYSWPYPKGYVYQAIAKDAEWSRFLSGYYALNVEHRSYRIYTRKQ